MSIQYHRSLRRFVKTINTIDNQAYTTLMVIHGYGSNRDSSVAGKRTMCSNVKKFIFDTK